MSRLNDGNGLNAFRPLPDVANNLSGGVFDLRGGRGHLH